MGLGTRPVPPAPAEASNGTLGLVEDLTAWTAATNDGTEPIGTVELQLTRAQADQLRWIVKADTKRLTTPKPVEG
jgi:hypothetical protein